MNGLRTCILTILCATIYLAVQSPGIFWQDSNVTKRDERASRFKRIVFLQKQVILKLQSQLLEQIQDCSNLRQGVRRIIASYKNLKSELEELKPKSGATDGPKIT